MKPIAAKAARLPIWSYAEHPARTAVAAVASYLAARWLRLPEAYWAPITTLVVMQSTLGAAWDVSMQRLVGTALGAGFGALAAVCFGGGVIAFGATIFLLGLVCAALRLGKPAYRFAGITVAIVMLITRSQSPWTIAVHRFIEVALGIAVALILTALWPQPEAQRQRNSSN
jgi:uncharacterized membrane protein YccC